MSFLPSVQVHNVGQDMDLGFVSQTVLHLLFYTTNSMNSVSNISPSLLSKKMVISEGSGLLMNVVWVRLLAFCSEVLISVLPLLKQDPVSWLIHYY